MNKGNLFVLTSQSEGLPHTLLESMSCGLVPISSDVGDISSVINNKQNGYLVEGGSENFKPILEELLNDKNLLKNLSNQKTPIGF